MSFRVIAVIVMALCAVSAVRAGVSVSLPPNASAVERLAARELQRYVYLRTGRLPVVSSTASAPVIVVASRDRATIADQQLRKAARALKAHEYILRTTGAGARRTWWVIGGDDVGTLYGAYRFAERLGVRFYLHGDVVPDLQIAGLPDLEETGRPIFAVRGIQPFHDFPEGPDWWSTDDYIAYISQLPKMRMNFIGFHCYPENLAEPSVWIGTSDDMDVSGRVTFSYPARWANTALDGFWGYAAMKTSEFCSGASEIFPEDNYGSEAMAGLLPAPRSLEECNLVFNNAADLFRTAFSRAKELGVQTCVGTETPLTIPALVRDRLQQKAKDPSDPVVIREVYEGMFQRIARACPVDYYWLWTPEGWTHEGNTDQAVAQTVQDIRCALAALERIGNPMTFATCGWVLGPMQDRTALDRVLPKECPISCINRLGGHAPIDPRFMDISGRPKWAIPWLENDPVLTAPQPWVGRMLYDAADAARLGCTGLLGIHWRTKQMSMNVAALAGAAWDQSWAPAEFKAWGDKQDGPLNGQAGLFPSPVADTDEDAVYQSVRYNVDRYRLVVPNGTYTVTLKFMEPFYAEAGRRVFGVKLQGKQVIEHLDVFARVGLYRALDLVYPQVEVREGSLRIDFTREQEFPFIAGIAIDGRTASGKRHTRRINCGGPQYLAYEADLSNLEDKSDHRSMPVRSFYADFARANFGDAVATDAAEILARIDGRGMPEPVAWLAGPGSLAPNREPWEKVRERYEFVDQFAALRSRIRTPGNRERFDYWLNTYRHARTLAELGCLRGQLDILAEAINAEQDPAAKRPQAREALNVRVRLSRLWEQGMTSLLQTVDTPGEMGTLDNLERQTRKTLQFLTKYDDLLAEALGTSLPEEIELAKSYSGPARIAVPTVRTQVREGEALRLRVIVLDSAPPADAALYWRQLGEGDYRRIPLRRVNRSVYEVEMPPASSSFEYYVRARTSGGTVIWPAAAPRLAQTVVVW